MATSTADYIETAQEQTLKTLRDGQQAIVDAVHAWAEAVERIAPPAPALPFGDHLPSPRDVVKTSFDFAEQLLKAQRDFAEHILAAAEPAFTPRENVKPKESK